MDEYPQHQRHQLLAIKDATTTEQRIEAIIQYCQAFSGGTKPEEWQSLFLYLLQQRQGSCRHRVVAFVGLCRYFAIPSRIIFNECHAFVEFSARGIWYQRDLGGAPGEEEISVPQFSTSGTGTAPSFSPNQLWVNGQPNPTGVTEQAEILFSVFNQASSEEQMYLAEVIAVDTETLRQAVRKRTPLTQANTKTAGVIEELWSKASLIGLSLGLTLLKAKGELNDDDERLIGRMKSDVYSPQPLGKAIGELISADVDTARLIQLLADMYKTVVVNGSTHPLIWHNTLVETLIFEDFTKPAAATLAREAFESGWILLEHKTPVPEDTSLINGYRLFGLLENLGQHEKFKALSDDYLERWYRQILRPRGDMSYWQKMAKNTIIDHNLSGHSTQLDSWLTVSSLNSTWSDEPEGIPDIGRLLAQVPAYRQTKSAQSHGRPVIIINTPYWNSRVLAKRAKELMFKKLLRDQKQDHRLPRVFLRDFAAILHRLEIEEELHIGSEVGMAISYLRSGGIPSIRCCDNTARHIKSTLYTAFRLLREQFCQYLFQKTTANGNQLHMCWFGARIEDGDIDCGSHQPSSPQELLAMFSHIKNGNRQSCDLNHALINQALNTNNALILNPKDIMIIFAEYLISTDLNLICDHWRD